MLGATLAYSLIKSEDRVLDIGGSAQPFRRANAVIDIMPYERRESHNSALPHIPEHFTKNTWVQRDLCDTRTPFPFRDKEFDFVVCGHVLEDVRDPLWVVKEIQRVAKRGYIEVPSRFNEQLMGVEHKKICGHSHHRWFLELRKNPNTGKNDLVFIFKNSLVHVDRKFQTPRPWMARLGFKKNPKLNMNYEVLGLYFDGAFEVYEDVMESVNNSRRFMAETVTLAHALGPRLWNRADEFPVGFMSPPRCDGIQSLWEMAENLKK